MDETKKQQLFPYFAYLYSQQLNPEKYGQVNSIEEWTKLIQESPEDIEKITAAAGELGEEDWTSLEQQYAEAQEESVQFAKKGAKLKQLKQGAVKNANKEVNTAVSKPVITQAKKGMKNPKRCKCGCELITVKEDGGKLTSKCACGCSTKKLKKHQTGGQVVNKGIITPTEFFSNLSTKPNSPQHYLPYSKKTDTFNGGVLPDVVAIAPRKTTIGSKTNPVKLPEVTVTAQDSKKKAISNPKVVEWQKKLKAEGFNVGPIDGIWGKDTEKAYKAYLKNKQNLEKVGLPQDNAPFIQSRAGFDPNASNYYGTMLKKGGQVTKAGEGTKTYNPKKPYSSSNFSGNAYNKELAGMKGSAIDSLQTYNKANVDESDPRNAKQLLNDLRSGKSKMPTKKACGGKMKPKLLNKKVKPKK